MNNKRTQTIVLAVTAALVLLGFFFMMRSCVTERSRATAIAFVGNETPTHWSGSYYSLDGTTWRTMKVRDGILTITTTTESGVISITVQDKSGKTLFDEVDLGNATYQVEASGKVKVIIEADRHEGSFDIRG